MLSILTCEDEIILELREPRLKEVVRKNFEKLRSQLAKVYVKKLREGYERELKAFSERLDLEFMPSRLIPKPPRGRDKAKTWIEQINHILENYEGSLRELKKRADQRRAFKL